VNTKEFYIKMDELDYLDKYLTKDGLMVIHKDLDKGVLIKYKDILNLEWDELYGRVHGEQPLHTMTRVIGYYAKIENFNPSKVRERGDRMKGNYTLAEKI